jgi:hypothetical protein
LVLAERSGLDPELAREVMLGTVAGQGHLGTTYPAKVLKDDLAPGFMIDLAFKDLGLALELASAIGAPVATGRAAREAYEQARAHGVGAQEPLQYKHQVVQVAALGPEDRPHVLDDLRGLRADVADPDGLAVLVAGELAGQRRDGV